MDFESTYARLDNTNHIGPFIAAFIIVQKFPLINRTIEYKFHVHAYPIERIIDNTNKIEIKTITFKNISDDSAKVN